MKTANSASASKMYVLSNRQRLLTGLMRGVTSRSSTSRWYALIYRVSRSTFIKTCLRWPFKCPIQTKLVDVQLLTALERKWLNSYHAEVLAKVRPLLAQYKDSRAIAWLERECAAI